MRRGLFDRLETGARRIDETFLVGLAPAASGNEADHRAGDEPEDRSAECCAEHIAAVRGEDAGDHADDDGADDASGDRPANESASGVPGDALRICRGAGGWGRLLRRRLAVGLG